LERQKLFRLCTRDLERRTWRCVTPSEIDFTNYYPIARPCLLDLVAAYGYHFRQGDGTIYNYDGTSGDENVTDEINRLKAESEPIAFSDAPIEARIANAREQGWI
jgi:hypothetical protein